LVKDPQKDLVSLERALENGRVKNAEIINLPGDIQTNHAMTAAELNQTYRYKLSIQQFSASKENSSLASILQRTVVTKTARETDLRWGVLLTLDGGQLRSIYLDDFGQIGELDGSRVSFQGVQGGLSEWLKGLFACLRV
jgi:hypothetical protein